MTPTYKKNNPKSDDGQIWDYTKHIQLIRRINWNSLLLQTEIEQNRCAMTCRGCGAVCFFTLKMAVTGLSQDSIVKVRPITNFKNGRSPYNCL